MSEIHLNFSLDHGHAVFTNINVGSLTKIFKDCVIHVIIQYYMNTYLQSVELHSQNIFYNSCNFYCEGLTSPPSHLWSNGSPYLLVSLPSLPCLWIILFLLHFPELCLASADCAMKCITILNIVINCGGFFLP